MTIKRIKVYNAIQSISKFSSALDVTQYLLDELDLRDIDKKKYPEDYNRNDSGLICVKCGCCNATEGSHKKPYCKKCFNKCFKDDEDYFNKLNV